MKNMMSLILLSAVMVICSCEENFSPKEEFEKQYAASCIIGIHSTASSFSAELFLSSSYDVEGVDPYTNNMDPVINGATALLTYGGDNNYIMEEDSSVYYHPTIIDSILWAEYNRYGNPYNSYVHRNIPVRYQPLRLSIELPNGKTLSSQTSLPKGIFLEYSYDFPRGITSNINQWVFGDTWEITWKASQEQMYFAELVLSYMIDDEIRSAEIPLQYVNTGTAAEPVYPKFNYPGKLSYSFDALDQFMKNISEGIDDKSRINILNASLSITELDKELSNYYSSINGYLDGYSIRLDEQVYSNINGGIGIFGSYRTTTIDYFLERQYVYSFGYQTNH